MHRRGAGVAAIKQKNLAQVLTEATSCNQFYQSSLTGVGKMRQCVGASRLTCKMRLYSASVRRTLPTWLIFTAASMTWAKYTVPLITLDRPSLL